MKLKNWVLWLCVAALLATEVFLFLAKSQKDTALVQLHEARQVAVQLRAQLDQLKNSSVATLSAENARLRAENQGLSQKFSQLQNESRQLRKSNQQLAQLLQATGAAAQQQPMPVEEPSASTAPESSAEPTAAAAAQLDTCINNLRLIVAAKQQWALDNSKTDDDTPTALELLAYFKDDIFPVCPSGGTYTINAVGVPPVCSNPGHGLPP